MAPVTLYGHPGWGSTIVEAQLAWLGIDFEFKDVGDLYESPEARAGLRRVNPLAQVPTLVLEDGQIMTESAAITLYLADRTGRDDFVPAPQSPERPAFLRWLVFIVANVYAVATFSDEPERFVPDEAARAGFRAAMDDHRKRLYQILEPAIRTPWFLGERFSALDLYLSVMSRWRPGRDWLAENAPKVHAIATRVDALPKLQAVWARNYPSA
jgi:GST-like protein